MKFFLKLSVRKIFLILVLTLVLFIVGDKKVAFASDLECTEKYGFTFKCYKTNFIREGKINECKSDITCSASNSKCCPASAIFATTNPDTAATGNTSTSVCSAGYSCKNTVGATNVTSQNGCKMEATCRTETFINGRCCPLTTPTPPTPTGNIGGITETIIPGTSVDASSGIVSCGRPGQDMCTICDLIRGMNIVIQYLMKIAIGVALLAMGIGGVMYVISAGDSGLIDKAKGTMKNAAIGFVVIFAGFLIINTTINYVGAKKDRDGNLTFGMNIKSWGQFECAAPTSGTR